MICKGADTVIPIEETEIDGSALRVLKVNRRHQHLRFEGEEFGSGELLLPQGKTLNASRIAVLASQGITAVPVYRKPEAAIILTGTELVPYDQPLEPWQIRDSNGIMLQTAVKESGGVVNLTASVGDNYEDTVAAVRKASESANLIIFSGGVSVGPHDLVKKAARECGFETMFWRVKQRPGKPLFFAKKDDVLFFGLPGNPVSAYMCYLYYIHPLLQFLQGKPFAHKSVKGEIGEQIENKINRAQLFRISLKEAEGHSHPLVYPLSKQGSHMLTSLSSAEGFILLEVGANLEKGKLIDVILWNE